MINFENFIFDLDGTLIDSRKDINSSIKEAIYKTKGVNIDDYSLKIGPPLDVMIRNFFTNITNEEVKEIITNFRSVYTNCGFNHTYCFNGIEKILQTLKHCGKSIYVATNKPAYITKIIIDKLKINFFDDICTIDTVDGSVLSKKEMVSLLIEKNNLDRKFTLLIGDSFADIYSASENAITSIGIGYGYETKDQILKANPDFYFDTVSQLNDFFNN